jgi:hypothetical protein
MTLTAAPAHRSAWATSHKILEFCPRFAPEVLGCCAPSAYCLVWVLRYTYYLALEFRRFTKDADGVLRDD